MCLVFISLKAALSYSPRALGPFLSRTTFRIADLFFHRRRRRRRMPDRWIVRRILRFPRNGAGRNSNTRRRNRTNESLSAYGGTWRIAHSVYLRTLCKFHEKELHICPGYKLFKTPRGKYIFSPTAANLSSSHRYRRH